MDDLRPDSPPASSAAAGSVSACSAPDDSAADSFAPAGSAPAGSAPPGPAHPGVGRSLAAEDRSPPIAPAPVRSAPDSAPLESDALAAAPPGLARSLSAIEPGADAWVFGYASLIWRPEFVAAEQRPAIVHGWHRALQMRSRVNRGTPERPGLVFALVRGGSCRGFAYRIDAARVEAEFTRLWAREMVTGVYEPKWLACGTSSGRVKALAFTLRVDSPSYTGPLPDALLVDILRTACGRCGSTLDYLVDTANSLRDCGIRDRDIERLVGLARSAGLTR